MDELENIVILKDEAGEDISFEFLDLIEYQENEYVVLLPTDTSDDESSEVVILKVESLDGPVEESYVGVEDQDMSFIKGRDFDGEDKRCFCFMPLINSNFSLRYLIHSINTGQ